jgi:ribose 1,5-bisphosphokinase PhnN
MEKNLSGEHVPLELSDDMVANLENYLPGSPLADKNEALLLDRIVDKLDQLDQRLQQEGRELKNSTEFTQHRAAQQAVQAAILTIQLDTAGRK